jgi:hypothetical protein
VDLFVIDAEAKALEMRWSSRGVKPPHCLPPRLPGDAISATAHSVP